MKTNKKLTILAAGLVLVGSVIISCKKKSEDPQLPSVGGYNSANDVASANLVAYWPFDNTLTESKQSLQGSASNTTFVTGAKSQALKGASNGYVVYASSGTALPTLQSFSIAFWMNTPQYSENARAIFQISNENSFWPNLLIDLEPYVVADVPNADTVRFKIEFTKAGAAFENQFIETKIGAAVNKWVHIVATYDAGTSKYYLFVNGAKIVLPDASINRYASDPATGGGPLGAVSFQNANRVIFGTWRQALPNSGVTPDPWMGNFEGSLDEFRIYKTALSDGDVSSLYTLEKAGR